MSLANASVLVTGGAGFLGQHVVRRLQAVGCRKVEVARQQDYDLTRESDVERLFGRARPEVVIHAAAMVGGIAFNVAHPAEVFYANVMMNTLVLEHARRTGVRKFVGVGSVCAYPEHTPVPFREEALWDGYPEPTNAPYGLSKKMMLVQGQAYRAQYGFDAVHLLTMNLYGPGDNFDPRASHVIPALIRRFLEAAAARQPEVSVWGDGLATREFLYVEDAARGVVLAAERDAGGEPINLGAGFEITVRELAMLIAELTHYRGRVVFDAGKPSGQRRRSADISRARRLLGFEPQIALREGLKRTIDWYVREHAGASA